jgi:excinuclease UvrABC helicase subunit UvrB
MDELQQKTLVVRSRYGSGKTYFLQQLIQKYDLKRVLFITYRQTLARDIMRNFKRLGFKNYLDAHEHPEVWNSPRLNRAD